MVPVVQDLLVGYPQLGVGAEGVPSVGIAVPAREAARSDLQPDAVAGLENVARCPQIDRIRIDPARVDRRRRLTLREMAVARAHEAAGPGDRTPVGVDNGEPGHE